MADNVLFVGWGRTTPGREQLALQVFQDTMAYWGRVEQQGEIDGVDVVLLGPHGGDLYGFMLVRGESGTLARLRASDEFAGLIMRADFALENLGVVPAMTGDAVAQSMQGFEQVLSEMTR